MKKILSKIKAVMADAVAMLGGRREINFYYASAGLRDSLLSLWYASTGFIGISGGRGGRKKLENYARDYFGAKGALAFGSARSALFFFLKQLDLPEESEVIVTGFTCSVVPNAVIQAGLKPIYADISADDLCMDPESVKRIVSPHTKAIIIQHSFGIPAKMDELLAIARENNLIVIEDCAVALGAKYKGRLVGTFGQASIISFELSKTITTCRGGMLIINDQALAEKASQEYERSVPVQKRGYSVRILLQLGLSGILYRPRIYPLGKHIAAVLFRIGTFSHSTSQLENEAKMPPNYLLRLSDQQANIAVRQWRRIDQIAGRSRQIAADYLKALENQTEVRMLKLEDWQEPNFIRYPILASNRSSIIDQFKRKGIEPGLWFAAPISSLRVNQEIFGYRDGNCPKAEEISRQIYNLPTHIKLSAQDIVKICDLLAGKTEKVKEVKYKQLLKKLPHPLRQGIRYVYGAMPISLRYSRTFWETTIFLANSQWWNDDQLKTYQLEQLKKLLSHAYINVPYYRKTFDAIGVKPNDINTISDIKKIPFLTKEIVQNNLSEFIARNYPKSRLQYATTGGSTGLPLGFYYDKSVTLEKERAFMLNQWRRVGYKIGDRVVILRGNVIERKEKNKFWEYDPVNRSMILSSYHLTEEVMPAFLDQIRRFKPSFMHVYPSAITILAKYMKDNNIGPIAGIKAILCGSENLYHWQRQILEEIFHCRVYSWYGHAEMLALAGECEVSTAYHVFPEYGLVELIDESDQPILEAGTSGEIIATGFNNYACPLIRYRTKDIAVLNRDKCKCGRYYPLLNVIEGRMQEMIVSRDGRRISMTAINMHSDVFDNIKQFQFYQDNKGELTMNIVRKPTYSNRDTEYVMKEMKKKLGADMNMKIRFVNEIRPNNNGKFTFLVQKLSVGMKI